MAAEPTVMRNTIQAKPKHTIIHLKKSVHPILDAHISKFNLPQKISTISSLILESRLDLER